MKRAGWCVSVFLLLIMSGVPANALETIPSSGSVAKSAGPFLITGYSFSGHSLRYVQIYNASSNLASLDGWQVAIEYSAAQHVLVSLNGMVEPLHYATAANSSVLPSATFTFLDATAPADPAITSVSLVAPPSQAYLNETAVPGISSSTPKIVGTPAIYYFTRNTSTATGNYLSTFTAFVPSANHAVLSDPLYSRPASMTLKIAEIYPDAPSCSPLDKTPTCSDYVKLYNPTNAPIEVSDLRLRTGTYGQSSTSSNTTRLSGTIEPGHYASVPITLSSTGSWVWLEDAYGLALYETTLTQYPSSSDHDGESWALDDDTTLWRWSAYPMPGDAANNFGPLQKTNLCTGLKINEIAANVATEDQFIEIINPTSTVIDMTGCAVQTNRSISKKYILSGELPSNGYTVIYIHDTELILSKTTAGVVYLLSSNLATEIDEASYAEQTENTSWAMFEGEWKRTYQMSVGALNVWLQYPNCESGSIRNNETGLCNKISVSVSSATECEAGKYRNPETNRCRTLESASSASTCDAGEYRNPDTNRCKSLISSSSVLTPCASNQERSPDTNRCRLIGSTTGELKPCAASQERNPETNRCRNMVTNSAKADFPVEAVAQGGEATLGWWAFGGVGTLAAGYAGWEWRREAVAWIKKAQLFGTSRP